MLAARPEYLQQNSGAIGNMLAALHEAVGIFHNEEGMAKKVSEVYGLKEEDAQAYVFGLKRVEKSKITTEMKGEGWKGYL